MYGLRSQHFSACILLAVVICSRLRGASSEKILGVLPFPCKSHAILGNTLLKELSRRGHEVTMISSFPLDEKVKNFRHIYVKADESTEIRNRATKYNFQFLQVLPMLDYFTQVNDLLLADVNVKRLVSSGEQFDLVLNLGMESILGLSHALNASTIRFNCLGMYSVHAALSMNPLPSAYVPNFLLPFSNDMDLLQRTMNTLLNLVFDVYIEYFWRSTENAVLHKHFPDAPHLSELQRDVQVTLVNSHMAIENIRPYLTNVIPIGGFHLQSTEQMHNDLKTYLDAATDGVILFSLGSSIKSEVLRDKVHILFKCFASLRYKILWKTDVHFEGLPANVKTMHWLPQKAVLGHPNVKAFISHGGLGSVMESVYYAVPMIIMPFVIDQKGNAVQSVRNGYAIHLNPDTLSEDQLRWAIREITTNPTYLKEIQVRSDAIRHQDVDPMEKAMFWIERVIKQKKLSYLNCAAKQMPLYKYYLLDVYALIFCTIFIFICICRMLFRLFMKYWLAISYLKVKTS